MRDSSPWWFLPAPVAVGILVGVAVSLAQPTLYRSETGVAVPAAATAALVRLARSDAVTRRVVANLMLHETPAALRRRTSVAQADAQRLLRIRYDDGDPQRGRRIAQELTLVFVQTVHDRLRGHVTLAVTEPVHTLPDPVSPRRVRNIVVGAIVGAVLGAVGAAVIARARARAGP